MSFAALIVAAGQGTRAGGGSVPKQYADLGGEPVLARALSPFLAHPGAGPVLVVIGEGHERLYEQVAALFRGRLLPPVRGGASRQESVRRGLEALSAQAPAPRLVLIHDAARPFVPGGVIGNVLEALNRHAGAVPGEPVTDTLKRADARGMIAGTVERGGLFRAQTPQGFHLPVILEAHRRAAAAGLEAFTDDAALAEWAGAEVALVAGAPENVKLTTAGDIAAARRRLEAEARHETRTGTGFDVHRFAPARAAGTGNGPDTAGPHVWLCGIPVPHTACLEGHSDADAGLHALTDALLGAIGEGDIGEHFPPSDPRWKGAASSLFLADAARRIAARGGRIVNADVTLICEAPKVAPHRAAMRAAIASVLGIEPSRVSVKATTTETLGFTGRREGIAALATATVLLPL